MSYGKRFAVVAGILLLYVGMIVTQSFRTVVVDGPEYRNLVAQLRKDSVSIPQVRGFIFADGGEMLAGSLPEYDVFLDFRTTTQKDKRGNMNIPPRVIDSFFGAGGEGSRVLAEIAPYRTADQWGKIVQEAYKRRERHFLLLRTVSYMDYKRLREETTPYFGMSRYLNGLHREERAHRYRPFGETRMAAATIGAVYAKDGANYKKGSGRGGIEEAYDSLLRGEPGLGYQQKIRSRKLDVTLRDPMNGADIYTTINVEMQDILDRALAKRLRELNAERGWSAVMEVKTGQIKAIANLCRSSKDTTYVEDYNHLTEDLLDPGSTFKTVSYVVMLEDGKVTPETEVNTGSGTWNYHGKEIRDDHQVGTVTARKAIEQSSNVAVAKLTTAAYEKDQQAYLDGVERTGIMDDLELRCDFPGAQAPRKRSLKEKTWSKVSLGQISYGYENRIPGISILNFYNTIANGGRMMRPYIVARVEKDGDVLYERKPETVRRRICSEGTLTAVRQALEDVVENGTAAGKYIGSKEVLPGAKSKRVKIAGKTGTAQRYANGTYSYSNGHYVSFVGYFPADEPQYTCIVVIDRPRGAGRPGGGYMAGPVFRQFAEEVYALHCERPLREVEPDTLHAPWPSVKRGPGEAAHYVLSRFRLDTLQYDTAELPAKADGLMPNVKDMGAEDALFMLESLGLAVSLSGRGAVTAQSIPAGTRIARGNHVHLTLK